MTKKPITVNKKRIETIFNEAMDRVRDGERPNISGLMRKHGYADTSARSLKVQASKTWQELLSDIDDSEILDTIREIMNDPEDKRSRLTAADMMAKLKDLYPAGKLQTMNITKTLEEVTDKIE